MANRTIRTDKKRRRFLAALGQGASVTAAAAKARAARNAFYMWRAEDAEFAAAWDDAFEAGTDRLADIATERGITESDALLIFMLKCRDPQRFNQKQQVSLSGDPDGPPIALAAAESTAPRIYLPHNYRDAPGSAIVPAPRAHVVEIEAAAEPVADETVENQATAGQAVPNETNESPEQWQTVRVKR